LFRLLRYFVDHNFRLASLWAMGFGACAEWDALFSDGEWWKVGLFIILHDIAFGLHRRFESGKAGDTGR
jgi:hypothetical protein